MPVEPLNIENVRWVNNTKEDILNRESFLLLNSYYHCQKYLEKYSIKENATFGGELLLITKSMCSPIGFSFDTINTTDYFEIIRRFYPCVFILGASQRPYTFSVPLPIENYQKKPIGDRKPHAPR